jgi:hypothetical protein
MNTREWLEHIRDGEIPAERRQKEQLAALRKLALIDRDANGYHLTPLAEAMLNAWKDGVYK